MRAFVISRLRERSEIQLNIEYNPDITYNRRIEERLINEGVTEKAVLSCAFTNIFNSVKCIAVSVSGRCKHEMNIDSILCIILNIKL